MKSQPNYVEVVLLMFLIIFVVNISSSDAPGLKNHFHINSYFGLRTDVQLSRNTINRFNKSLTVCIGINEMAPPHMKHLYLIGAKEIPEVTK